MTVQGILTLLKEQSPQLVKSGLEALLLTVDIHWPLISNELKTINELTKVPTYKELASLLCAKIQFHFKQYDEALEFALSSGRPISRERSEFDLRISHMCIERFIQHNRQLEKKLTAQPHHPLIIQYVQTVISQALKSRDVKVVLGLALQSQSLSLVREVSAHMTCSSLTQYLIPYLPNMDPAFRGALVEFICKQLQAQRNLLDQDYIYLVQLYRHINNFHYVAKTIYELLKIERKELSYSLCLQVSEMHGFVHRVIESIPIQAQWQHQRKKLIALLEGRVSAQLYSLFLTKNNKTDPHYLALLREIDSKHSIPHSSAILSISILTAYTQDDSFFKVNQNLQWAGKTSFWAKFSSVASLGIIFKGAKQPAQQVFKKYLPQNNQQKHPFMYGGALYGMGIMTVGSKNDSIVQFLYNVIENPLLNHKQSIVHGACLGLGLNAFATADQNIYQKLKNILDTDTAVTGEAAGLGIGLLMAGSNNEQVIADLLSFQTEHDKINRAINLAIALTSINSPSQNIVSQMRSNPNKRKGLPIYLASAYAFSGNASAVKELLALSCDISNQIKRSAVICMGFVLHNDPELISIMKMMSSSYNPHIRYGLCLALAIGGSLEQSQQIVDIIWPFLTDTTEFVRQSAILSIAMIALNGGLDKAKLGQFRKIIQTILAKKHQDPLIKMGAILAVGIIDAGGRNLRLSIRSKSGLNILGLASMLVFSEFWHWFPLINFLGLCFSPAVLIGIDNNFKVPLSFSWRCNCKPSLFSYPANIIKEEKKQANKKEVVELSTHRRVQSKLNRGSSVNMEIQKPQEKPKEAKAEPQPEEPAFYVVNNPSRVLNKQADFIVWHENRYSSLLGNVKQGIVFLRDSLPGQAQQYLGEKKVAATPLKAVQEVQQPQEFIYG